MVTTYTRELPGGGHVIVELDVADGGAVTYRAILWVERRTDPQRRVGHDPPILAEAEGATERGAADPLVAIAADNVAVARAIRDWQLRQQLEPKRD